MWSGQGKVVRRMCKVMMKELQFAMDWGFFSQSCVVKQENRDT